MLRVIEFATIDTPPSFRRKPESSFELSILLKHSNWIPAFAGMTGVWTGGVFGSPPAAPRSPLDRQGSPI